MSTATLILDSDESRRKAARWCMGIKAGTSVTFREGGKRSLDQNAMLHALCTDIAQQVVWHGEKLTVEDWKDMLTAALKKARVVPGIEPDTTVVIGLHTSDLSVGECADLITLAQVFGDAHGVKWSNEP